MTQDTQTNQNQSGTNFVLRSEPRIASFSEGVNWFTDGFKLFAKSPLAWMVAFVLWTILNFILVLVLFTASKVLWPIFLAGFMVGSYQLDKYNIFPYDSLFSGFTHRGKNLIMLGLYYFAAFIVVQYFSQWVTELFIGDLSILSDQKKLSSLYTANLTGQITPEQFEELLLVLPQLLFVSLLLLSLLLPVYMALWFAPALVAINGVSPINAFRLSFIACLRNMMSFLGYGFITFAAIFIAAIPMGLGLFIVMPVIFASIYVSYKDIFIDESGAADSGSGGSNSDTSSKPDKKNKIGIEV